MGGPVGPSTPMEGGRFLAASSQDNNVEAHVVSWVVFTISVGALLALDVTCLQRPLSVGRVSFHTAVKLTTFWLAMGLLFDLFILGYLGWEASLGFLQGFFLEYMLSFDNLFVFHLVFSYYCTPEALLYRALYFGIAGAIILRVFFLLLGFTFMNSGLYIVKFIFGAILIWSGIRSANDFDDEDTADPTNNRFISWVTKNLPVSDNYEPHGHFFITVPEVECRPPRSLSTGWDEGDAIAPEAAQRQESLGDPGMGGGLPRLESFEGSSLLDPHRSGVNARSHLPGEATSTDWMMRAGSSDNFEVRRPAKLKRKASLLLLVVIAVWVVDLVFAVDSVASKLASVSDVFLNCSSSAFAMLSLRSLYFVMESLTRTFQMLKYGIAAILILIGLKLVFVGWLAVSNGVCFAVIMGIVVASMASSYWMPRFRENCERIDLGGITPIAEEEEDRQFFERKPALEPDVGSRRLPPDCGTELELEATAGLTASSAGVSANARELGFPPIVAVSLPDSIVTSVTVDDAAE